MGDDGINWVDRYLVIDVETTGLYNSDRIVEIAAVTVTRQGEVIDEWDTLVNPERDIGAHHLHGITASMVSAAPVFSEVASALAVRIDGAVLVAHNLAFDSRMLSNEYKRIGAHLDRGEGLCTLSLSGQRLADACACHGIPLEDHHRALADARATANLFARITSDARGRKAAFVRELDVDVAPRTLRREAVSGDASGMPHLARLAVRVHYRGECGRTLEYLDMLDWALADLVITDAERGELGRLAAELGMNSDDVARAHERYVRELVAAAARDNVVTEEEETILKAVAAALGMSAHFVEEAIRPWQREEKRLRLHRGMTVCFTGSAISANGLEVPREVLVALAETLGLRVVDSVTKKGCDVVVAGDPSSQSGKARKARDYGLPLVWARDFLSADAGICLPAC